MAKFLIFWNDSAARLKKVSPYSDTYIRYNDWDLIFGVKKDFRFSKHVKGTSQVGYNVFYAPNSSPYASRWHLMFGLHYKFKVKKRFGK